MVVSRTSIKTNNSDSMKTASSKTESSVELKKTTQTSSMTRNILNAIGSRFFSGTQLNTEPKPETKKREKVKHKEPKKKSNNISEEEAIQKTENIRELQRFKARYNHGIGNIMRNWLSLIYSILRLKENLTKFLLFQCPESNEKFPPLEDQIQFERQTMFQAVQLAQKFSQEHSVHLWNLLEKLLESHMCIKNALKMANKCDTPYRDWMGGSAKLALVQDELRRVQALRSSLQKTTNTATETYSKLEDLIKSKNAEMESLIGQITECKKREVQMRGKILLNMKCYKDLKTKRLHLIQIEKDLNQLKEDQNTAMKVYSEKIEDLKNKIDITEKAIIMEKEERKRLKANLEGFGDFSEKNSAVEEATF